MNILELIYYSNLYRCLASLKDFDTPREEQLLCGFIAHNGTEV